MTKNSRKLTEHIKVRKISVATLVHEDTFDNSRYFKFVEISDDDLEQLLMTQNILNLITKHSD